MRTQHILLVLALLFLVGGKGIAQTTSAAAASNDTTIGSSLSLQQAVAIGIKNNLAVNQADLQMQSNRISLSQSWTNMLPNLNASANQGIGFGRSLNPYDYTYTNRQINSGSYGISTNLTLFQGLQLQNAIRQNKFAYSASQLDYEQQKDNITLSILLDYLQVLSSQDLLAIANEQANVDKRQVDRLDAQNKEGALLLLSNLSDLQGQYAGDQINIAAAINTLETAKVNLFRDLNVPYKKDVEYDRSTFSLQLTEYGSTSENIYATALQAMPNIRSTDLQVHVYQKALAVARGAYYPTLSFYGSVNTSYSNAATAQIQTGPAVYSPTGEIVTVGGTNYDVQSKQAPFTSEKISFGDQFKNNRYTSIGLQLNVPILNYFRVRNNVKKAKLNLKNQELIANSTKLALQQNVEMAFQNMIAAYKQYKFYIDQVAAFKESFRTTEIRFNEGVINSDIYVQSKNRVDAANVNLSVAKYTYVLRTKILDYYQGKLSW